MDHHSDSLLTFLHSERYNVKKNKKHTSTGLDLEVGIP